MAKRQPGHAKKPTRRPRRSTTTRARIPKAIRDGVKAEHHAVMREIQAVLGAHGMRMTEVHFAAGARVMKCPKGHVRRMVCVRDANGTLVCEPQCVPV
jgi:hypothetical protein